MTVVSLLTSGAGSQRMENTSKPVLQDATPETEEGTLTELNLWLRREHLSPLVVETRHQERQHCAHEPRCRGDAVKSSS